MNLPWEDLSRGRKQRVVSGQPVWKTPRTCCLRGWVKWEKSWEMVWAEVEVYVWELPVAVLCPVMKLVVCLLWSRLSPWLQWMPEEGNGRQLTLKMARDAFCFPSPHLPWQLVRSDKGWLTVLREAWLLKMHLNFIWTTKLNHSQRNLLRLV